MNTLHHRDGAECPLCNWKLNEAHPVIADWFHRSKKVHVNMHIAWAYRSQADQDKMVAEKKSLAKWPTSKHNARTDDLKPCAEALDIFLLDKDGNARWPKIFYAKLAAENKANGEPIKWSGEFKSILESNHFELKRAKSEKV